MTLKQLIEAMADKARFEAKLLTPREKDLWMEGATPFAALLEKAMDALKKVDEGTGTTSWTDQLIARTTLAEIEQKLEEMNGN